MTKGRKTVLVAVAALLVSVVAYSVVTVLFPPRRLALTEFHGPRGGAVFGLSYVEPTFENHVIYLSSNVIVGTVLTTPPEGASVGFYDVKIEENILSRMVESTIKVYGEGDLLTQGETYLLLLSRFAATVYPFDFYVARSDFTFRVDVPSDQVQRLANPAERVFIAPFQDPRYNSLSRLRAYIRSLAPANQVRSYRFLRNRDVQVIEEAPSQAALINMADHILMIEVVSAELIPNGMLTRAGFTTLKEFKGEGTHGAYSLLLPPDAKVNQRYLIFLVEAEDGGVTWATRRGSVVAEDDPEFSSLLEKLTASGR
ncbi:MAG: hypothetical protein KGZ92_09650 [Firmicutes bacterium]|nr:hypothetical protein [Dethiobacter sp.]MBS3889526.1 hypothetical protein [Bacillota bacterium]